MPEDLRALVVILFLACLILFLAGKDRAILDTQQNFRHRKKLWFLLTITAFLANNFWLYALVLIITLRIVKAKEPNPPALFFFLLFLLPNNAIQIPGFGLINFLIEIDHVRLLVLALLLPLWLRLRSRSDTPKFGSTLPDKIFACHFLLIAVLFFSRTESITASIRSFVGMFIDLFLPYYAFSRGFRQIAQLKDAMSSFVVASMIIGAVGIFETVRHWLLYRPVIESLGLIQAFTGYLPREGLLRAIASTGHPIALGYVIVIAIGFYIVITKAKVIRMLGLVLLAGVIAPLSRGPWLGLALMGVTFAATARSALSSLSKLLVVSGVAFLVLAMLPGGGRILEFLPFIGKVETANIDYRQKLIDNSLITIQRNPFFGSSSFLEYPEMQELMQGQGIIDMTNSYLASALFYGVVGLGMFIMFFLVIGAGLLNIIRKKKLNDDIKWLGRGLLAVLMAILLILSTVSSITIIPVVYWSFAGMAVGYIQIVKKMQASVLSARGE